MLTGLHSTPVLPFDQLWQSMSATHEAEVIPGLCVVENETDARLQMLATFAQQAREAGVRTWVAEQSVRDTLLHGDPEPVALHAFADALDATRDDQEPLMLVVPRIELPLPDLSRIAASLPRHANAYLCGGAATCRNDSGSGKTPDLVPCRFALMWHSGDAHGVGAQRHWRRAS